MIVTNRVSCRADKNPRTLGLNGFGTIGPKVSKRRPIHGLSPLALVSGRVGSGRVEPYIPANFHQSSMLCCVRLRCIVPFMLSQKCDSSLAHDRSHPTTLYSCRIVLFPCKAMPCLVPTRPLSFFNDHHTYLHRSKIRIYNLFYIVIKFKNKINALL